MQIQQSATSAGSIVHVRRQPWRVLDTHAEGDLRLVTLAGAGASNDGLVQRFITPFDEVQCAGPAAPARSVPQRRWRRALRTLLASAAPPGALRVLPRAAIDLLPHQLDPVLAIVRGACTRVLLADDVGLGKTIEAGLVLAELRARRAAARALVITPAGLRDQWRRELLVRFGIEGTVADVAALRSAAAAFSGHVNPWLTCDVAIASIDLVKRPEHLANVLKCAWDLLVVDEAHDAVGDTDRQAAIAAIATRTPYVVLVTATPHNGDRTAFASLCSIGAHGDAVKVFRRTRDDVRLPIARRVHRLRIRPTAAERRMHESLAAFTRAVAWERGESSRDVWLALAVLNKRALSSAWALRRSIARRLAALSAAAEAPYQQALPLDDPDGELDSADEAPAWIGAPALADAGRERRLLLTIEHAADEAVRAGESKINAIRRWLRRAGEPAIVFTEYRDTLQRLATELRVPVLQLHGGLAAVERRAVLQAFSAAGEPWVLLATDAAGEGLNLHERCRLVVNLELPWNPVRIEQRIGRVDRIGQTKTVHAVALIAGDTAEERILDRLRRRIARARYDVRGADPLQIVTEADVERLVLADRESGKADLTVCTTPDNAADLKVCTTAEGVADLRVCTTPDAGEAEREVERAALHRRAGLVSAGACFEGSGALIGVIRHRKTRRRMGRSILLVAEAMLEDGCGRVVERTLLPLRLFVDADLAAAAVALAQAPIGAYAAPVLESWRADAERLWRAGASARLERARAIAAEAARRQPATVVQSGLFDRRAERALAAARAAANVARETADRRVESAVQAIAASTGRIVIRLVLRSGP